MTASRTLSLTTLTSDWDIGDGKYIVADGIKARGSSGASLIDSGGSAGITVTATHISTTKNIHVENSVIGYASSTQALSLSGGPKLDMSIGPVLIQELGGQVVFGDSFPEDDNLITALGKVYIAEAMGHSGYLMDVQGTQNIRGVLTVGGTVILGGTSASGYNPAMSIERTAEGDSNAHGIPDYTTVTLGATYSYASFDARVEITGSVNNEHYVGFQSAPTYNSSGTMARYMPFASAPTVEQGTVTKLAHYFVQDATKSGGTITTQYGFYASETLSAGSTNYAFYSEGTTPSYFGGLVGVAGNLQLYDGKYILTDKVRAIDGDGLYLQDDGGNGMFIEDGGNIGIRTTNPAYHLDEDYSQNAYNVWQLKNGNAGNAAGAVFSMASDSAAFGLYAFSTTFATALYTQKAVFYGSSGASELMFFKVGNYPVTFYTNSLQRMKIEGDGDFVFGSGDSGKDYTFTIDGQSNDCVLTWMEDEDYLKFSDDIMMDSTEAIYFRDTDIFIKSATDGRLVIAADTSLQLGDASVTNYVRISASGNMTFLGSAGFYPRRISQSSEPANGTGDTQIDVGELIIWRDPDDNKTYLVYNDTDEGVRTMELT